MSLSAVRRACCYCANIRIRGRVECPSQKRKPLAQRVLSLVLRELFGAVASAAVQKTTLVLCVAVVTVAVVATEGKDKEIVSGSEARVVVVVVLVGVIRVARRVIQRMRCVRVVRVLVVFAVGGVAVEMTALAVTMAMTVEASVVVVDLLAKVAVAILALVETVVIPIVAALLAVVVIQERGHAE